MAIHSVIRIECGSDSGTGFLHKSGNLITAHHVIAGCSKPTIITETGRRIEAIILARNEDYDLALLKPIIKIDGTALALSQKTNFSVGTQVSTWGFPGGYNGLSPMLSVGYIGGLEAARNLWGDTIKRWVVNAAFNRGNSGGPLLDIESGEVVGVVVSKVVPISPRARGALSVLKANPSGVMYSVNDNGVVKQMSEAQIAGIVLEELTKQVQLVIGLAISVEHTRKFLVDQKIEP